MFLFFGITRGFHFHFKQWQTQLAFFLLLFTRKNKICEFANFAANIIDQRPLKCDFKLFKGDHCALHLSLGIILRIFSVSFDICKCYFLSVSQCSRLHVLIFIFANIWPCSLMFLYVRISDSQIFFFSLIVQKLFFLFFFCISLLFFSAVHCLLCVNARIQTIRNKFRELTMMLSRFLFLFFFCVANN